jgi:putative NIF3 family GTP cyclohydrolase 1 type 2
MTDVSRRVFLAAAAAGLAAVPRRAAPAVSPLTIQEAIERIVAASGAKLPKDTADTLKAGDPKQALSGIVATCVASMAVLERAAGERANLVVTHEPTFYNHLDSTARLEHDPVYQAKRRLLDRSGIVLFRFHDGWHLGTEDGIERGFLKKLGWERFRDPHAPSVCAIPEGSLRDLVGTLKRRLGVAGVRVVGDGKMRCRRVALLPGAWDSERQMRLLAAPDVDVLVCGETREWETLEYARDAVHAGQKKALVLLGHMSSEEPGMEWCAAWMAELFPGVRVTHLPSPSVAWMA